MATITGEAAGNSCRRGANLIKQMNNRSNVRSAVVRHFSLRETSFG
jgi:hypothetical protein